MVFFTSKGLTPCRGSYDAILLDLSYIIKHQQYVQDNVLYHANKCNSIGFSSIPPTRWSLSMLLSLYVATSGIRIENVWCHVVVLPWRWAAATRRFRISLDVWGAHITRITIQKKHDHSLQMNTRLSSSWGKKSANFHENPAVTHGAIKGSRGAGAARVIAVRIAAETTSR